MPVSVATIGIGHVPGYGASLTSATIVSAPLNRRRTIPFLCLWQQHGPRVAPLGAVQPRGHLCRTGESCSGG